jgi:hypothetical protein
MDAEEYEMRLPNGVGEQVLAHTIEQFEVKLKQTEYGPKLIGTQEELQKAKDFMIDSIKKRLEELEK